MALVTTGDEALSHFAASIARNPNDSRVRLLYGNALMGMGHNIAAWHQWQAALQLDPLPPETHLSFVKALPGLGRGEEVESHVRRALELEPDNPTTLLEVGDHRMRQGRPVEAVRMYLKGHTLDPQAIAPIMRIGMILLGLRDRETAARWIDR
jgi:Flp pilus assembly protein TadD